VEVDVNEMNESATVFDGHFVHDMDPDGDEEQNVRYSILESMCI
jgi:hypothetical protein